MNLSRTQSMHASSMITVWLAWLLRDAGGVNT
jgi:hypothetical protein